MRRVCGRIAALIAIFAAAATIAACAATQSTGESAPANPNQPSEQKLEYYPYLVKGYQNSYQPRRLLVLLPVDARDQNAFDAGPIDGNPAVGVIADASGNVIQRLFTKPLGPTVRDAIVHAAGEAGMHASAGDASVYSPGPLADADYVLAAKITKCWVKKRRGLDTRAGTGWASEANFTMEVIIYKPPFDVPFWQGTTTATYYDPPIGQYGLGPEDEAGIYDEPGEVLSVAMTRAVAGIFDRDDLRTLIREDHMVH